jgi:hypothetical protein
MAVHVVGFTDIIRFDGNTPVNHGRRLVDEYYNTAAYMQIQPGDSQQPFSGRPHEIWDFVEAKPFSADLEITTKFYFGPNHVTLHNVKTDTYYPMFLQDFVAMASVAIVIRGRITGRFGYVKKNKNFGINYLGEM